MKENWLLKDSLEPEKTKFINAWLHIDKFDDIGNEYNNTYSTIKMKPVDVKSSIYIDFDTKQ